MCPQTSSSVSEPLSFPPQKGNRTLDSLTQCPGGWYPKKGRVRPRLRTQHSEPLSPDREEPRRARAQLRTESPDGGWGGPRQITELHPVQELEACRPIMASEWPLAGKGCPAELQTAVTMENLPSPPRSCPPASSPGRGAAPPARRLQSQTVSLTQRALQTWPRGGTAGARLAKSTSCSSGVGKGGGGKVRSSG